MTGEPRAVNRAEDCGLATSVQGLVRALQRHPPSREWTPTDHHEAFEAAAASRAVSSAVTIQPAQIGGVAAEWHHPKRCRGPEVLLYLHGGGFIMGSLATTRPMASHLADLVGRRVLVIDYALAPEEVFPAQLEEVVACYRWLVENDFAASNIVLAGDSAGGGLALATAQFLRDSGEPAPGGLALLSPLLDLRLQSPSIDRNAHSDPQMPRWLLEMMVGCYVGERHSADNPRVSPLLGELTGLPPLLVQVADCEALLDDALALAESARAAGVATELQVWRGMIHVWHAFAHRVPEAVEALRAVGTWLDDKH